MEIRTTKSFDRDWRTLPPGVKRRARKKFDLLLKDPRHPSLGLKKMKGYQEIWEGRITRDYRFTFQITGQGYLLRRIGSHDILRKP